MNALEQCLEDLAKASLSNAESIAKVAAIFAELAERIEKLEKRVDDLSADSGKIGGTETYEENPWR